ncbi:MAG: TIM44-like domain-containing protein [Eubacteriales bacterium]|nr:TIM44-like domain-containing protein [Eubacteriales bacterium]
MRKKRLVLLLLACALVLFAIGSLADVGNFSGNSDYGGSSHTSSRDNDSSYSYSSSALGAYLFENTDPRVGLLIVVVSIIVLAIWVKRSPNEKGESYSRIDNGGSPVKTVDLSSIREKDPRFSEAAFLQRISNLYVRMQKDWERKEFQEMRHVMTDQLFNQLNEQLMEYVSRKRTNHVERIAVLNSKITGYGCDGRYDRITVLLNTRIVDYVTEDATGRVVSGSDTAEKFMTYEWTLIRGCGNTTDTQAGFMQVHCPSCGAPMEISQSAKCEYCGAVTSASDHDWVISAMRGLSQRTAR